MKHNIDIKVKTTAKTVSGVLEAIVNQHFIAGEGTSTSNSSGIFATLYTRDSVKKILDNFVVIPKSNNEFGLEASNE